MMRISNVVKAAGVGVLVAAGQGGGQVVPLSGVEREVPDKNQFTVENHFELRQENSDRFFFQTGSVKIFLTPIHVTKEAYPGTTNPGITIGSLDGPGLLSLQASELSLEDASFIQNELRQPTSDLSNSLLTYLTETDFDIWHPLYENSLDIVQRFIEDHAVGRYDMRGNSKLNLKLMSFLATKDREYINKWHKQVFNLQSGQDRRTKTEIDNIVSMSYTVNRANIGLGGEHNEL